MTSDHVVISLEDCAGNAAKELQLRGDTVRAEAAVASEFLARHGPENRHIAPRRRWIKWCGERRILESPGCVFALIRKLVLAAETKERRDSVACITGDAAGARLDVGGGLR